MRKALSGVAITLALAGCNASTSETTTPASPPPANYKAAVVNYVKTTFFDPYSIRDASISQPVYRQGIYDGTNIVAYRGWAVCLRANAKNRMGAYTGLNYSLLLFKGDVVELSLSGPTTQPQVNNHCKDVPLEPFPEIESTN
ncbi:MAG: hypothetical protein H6883_07065 [Rhodobiaceae bacterium]|nr:hypothetical protein [Rhodobiaceae bacterium]MCC0055880.1 hypothetical protein [Rhodobiaceae bacterium]